MNTQWLHATTTVPTVTLISLAGWAAFATFLAAVQWWLYRMSSAHGPIPWDDRPPATATGPAESGRDTMRETG